MKQISLLLTACVVAIASFAQQPYMTKSLAGKNIREVEALTSGGNIQVYGVSDGESKLEVVIRGNRSGEISKEEIEKRLADSYNLEISTDGGKLIAKAKHKPGFKDWRRGLSISFNIYTPKNVATKISTSGGNIVMKSLSGTQDFGTSGGNLELADLSGKIKGSTSGGNISFKGLSDEIRLSTSGGNISAENSSGTMNLSTSGGSVHLANLKGNIDASTSGGNIQGQTIDGELVARTSGGSISFEKMKGSIETSTSGGNITVEMLELGKYLKIDGTGGNISINLPKNKGLNLKLRGDKINMQTLANFSGTIKDNSVDGTLNGGGTPVNVGAGGGRLNVSWN